MAHPQGQPATTPTMVPQFPVDSRVPKEVLNLIPEFNGETKTLSLFLRKCTYVITRYQGTTSRNEFLMQCITSKLIGKAAALISERGDFETYEELQALLVQHFGDPRSEECVALELETLKMKSNESYLEFCGRIQDVRAILLSKVNQNSSATLREAKRVIYNNTSLNVFLYNLPEHMVRLVRMKDPNSLEDALKHVLEEVNFQEQYNMRTKMLQNKPMQFNFRPALPAPQGQFKFGIPNQINNFTQPNNLNFPRAPMPMQFKPQFNSGARPQFGFRPQVSQPIGFRPQAGQFGYRPQLQPAQGGFKPQPGQFGYRPPQLGFRPQPGQFNYRAPQPQGPRPNPHYTNDVSMRTAPYPQKANINEMYTTNEGEYNYQDYDYDDADYQTYYDDMVCKTYDEPQHDASMYQDQCTGENQETLVVDDNQRTVNDAENFRLGVSTKIMR